MQISITSAIIIESKFTMDLVILETGIPSPVPRVTDNPLQLMFHVEKGTAEKYLATNFPNIPFNKIPV